MDDLTFENMEGLWRVAPTDIKQSIIQAADPQTARNLCKLNNQSRAICRNRLHEQTKYRVCLGDDNSAVECDQVPMFSRQQFLAVIPVQIKIYPNDLVQLTHVFYSQNYKLPTEGFVTALFKAKLMNTICAIIRPEFLLTPEATTLLLPPYLDTKLIDAVTTQFSKLFADATTYEMKIFLDNADATSRISIGTLYQGGFTDVRRGPISADINIHNMPIAHEQNLTERIVQDDRIAEYIKARVRPILVNQGNSLINLIESTVTATILNVFQLSRLLKIAFDLDHYHNATLFINLDRKVVIYTAL